MGPGTEVPRSGSTPLAGVHAPICTPFDAREDVDHGALRANLERYAAAGIHGYLALGSNGENRSLFQEKVTRLNQAISGAYGVSGVKAAMDLAGYVGGLPRRPLLPLDDAARARLRELLEAEGLL